VRPQVDEGQHVAGDRLAGVLAQGLQVDHQIVHDGAQPGCRGGMGGT
jgi:hypothetical protein